MVSTIYFSSIVRSGYTASSTWFVVTTSLNHAENITSNILTFKKSFSTGSDNLRTTRLVIYGMRSGMSPLYVIRAWCKTSAASDTADSLCPVDTTVSPMTAHVTIGFRSFGVADIWPYPVDRRLVRRGNMAPNGPGWDFCKSSSFQMMLISNYDKSGDFLTILAKTWMNSSL